jgi:hypothetical protein
MVGPSRMAAYRSRCVVLQGSEVVFGELGAFAWPGGATDDAPAVVVQMGVQYLGGRGAEARQLRREVIDVRGHGGRH